MPAPHLALTLGLDNRLILKHKQVVAVAVKSAASRLQLHVAI